MFSFFGVTVDFKFRIQYILYMYIRILNLMPRLNSIILRSESLTLTFYILNIFILLQEMLE